MNAPARIRTTRKAKFLIYGPSGGTPFLARMEKEGRLNKDYEDLALREGFSLMFNHPQQKVVDLYAEIKRVVGKPSLSVRALSYAALVAAEWTKIRMSTDVLMQPRTIVSSYNWENYSPHASDAWRVGKAREAVGTHASAS